MLFKVHYDLDPATKTNHDDRASQDAMILNGGGRQMKCWQIVYSKANKQDMTCGISSSGTRDSRDQLMNE